MTMLGGIGSLKIFTETLLENLIDRFKKDPKEAVDIFIILLLNPPIDITKDDFYLLDKKNLKKN